MMKLFQQKPTKPSGARPERTFVPNVYSQLAQKPWYLRKRALMEQGRTLPAEITEAMEEMEEDCLQDELEEESRHSGWHPKHLRFPKSEDPVDDR